MSYDAKKLRDSIEKRNIGDYFYVGHEFGNAGVKTDNELQLAMDLVYSYVDSGHLKAKFIELPEEDQDQDELPIPLSSLIAFINGKEKEIWNSEGIEASRNNISIDFQRIATVDEYKTVRGAGIAADDMTTIAQAKESLEQMRLMIFETGKSLSKIANGEASQTT